MNTKFFHFAFLALSTTAILLSAPCRCIASATPDDTLTLVQGHQEESVPILTFQSMEHDFGTIAFRSKPQSFAFRFRNEGNAPLVITRTEQSCTCLSVKYPRKPVMPGEEGVVEITYSPKKDMGYFNNYVKVFSNTHEGSPAVLFARGEVVK